MIIHKHTYDESLTCACGHCIKLNGVWPSQTWFQTRLAQVRVQEAIKQANTPGLAWDPLAELDGYFDEM